jgi:hypothetical protein
LEGAADSKSPNGAWVEARNLLSLEADGTAVSGKLTIDQIETGTFSGAVGTNHRQHLSGLKYKIDLIHGQDAAESFGQTFDFKDIHSDQPAPEFRLDPWRSKG